MRAKRVCRDEKFRLIMKCRGSGLSDYQWCMENDILPGTFYMWINRLRKAGYTIPDSAVGPKSIPVIQEVVKLPVVDCETEFNQIVVQNDNNPITDTPAAIEIELDGMTIRIHSKADTEMIRSVLQIVGGCTHVW